MTVNGARKAELVLQRGSVGPNRQIGDVDTREAGKTAVSRAELGTTLCRRSFMLMSAAIAGGCAFAPPQQFDRRHHLSRNRDASVDSIIERFARSRESQSSYIADLVLIAILSLDVARGEDRFARRTTEWIAQKSYKAPLTIDSYETQLFCSLPFELIRLGRSDGHKQAFVSESERYRADVLRGQDGAVSYYLDITKDVWAKSPSGPYRIRLDAENRPLLLDHVQEYASRMAKAGWLSGDARFYQECARQFAICREALRDPASGLWAHGRGWNGNAHHIEAPKWGRAQAWGLRGLVEAIGYMPRSSPEYAEVSAILREFADALSRYQDDDGFWHQLVDRPKSFQETSSTAMISYDFARAVILGALPKTPFASISRKAFRAIEKHSISREGAISGGSTRSNAGSRN